jgi:hypothetical protein
MRRVISFAPLGQVSLASRKFVNGLADCRKMVSLWNSDHFVGINEMVEGSSSALPHRICVHPRPSVVKNSSGGTGGKGLFD